jgi:AcrR family transcriptional regulator
MQLIANGRFLNATMQEIAFQARMSEATVAYIFENRQQLLAELIEYIVGNIHTVMDEATRPGIHPFRERFFGLWRRLYSYYITNPGLPIFLNQFDVLSGNARTITLYPGHAQQLTSFFRSTGAGSVDLSDADDAAYIFHENILSAAQMKSRNVGGKPDAMASRMPDMLWMYLAGDTSNTSTPAK